MADITCMQIFEEFNQYSQTGIIRAIHLTHILDNLGVKYEHAEITKIEQIRNDSIPFDELLAILTDLVFKNIEKEDEETGDSVYDKKIHLYLRLLGEYIEICESNSDYINMQKTKLKIEEIRKHERGRFKKLLKKYQNQEVKQIKKEKKVNDQEFDQQWKSYFQQFEKQAYQHLQYLKKQHIQQKIEFETNLRKELTGKFRISRNVIEIRFKEQQMLKLQQYEEAHKLKQQADILVQKEQEIFEQQVEEQVQIKMQTFKKQLQQQLMVFLNKIQSNKTVFMKQKLLDEQLLNNQTNVKYIQTMTKHNTMRNRINSHSPTQNQKPTLLKNRSLHKNFEL